jgi:flagellar capping protein FliD
MTASTKLRITTNQRKVLKLEAQQEAYRSIIDKFNAFKDKYFDILNGDTFLRSRGTFNRHAAQIFINNEDGTRTAGTPAGVRVTTSNNATAGNYNVTVNAVATQASMQSRAVDSASSVFATTKTVEVGGVDTTVSIFEAGKTYSMSVTVGGVSRLISFQGGNSEQVQDSINAQLRNAFGITNPNSDGESFGMVYTELDDDGNLKFISREKRAISTGTPTELKGDIQFTLDGWESKSNSVTIVVGNETRTVNFQTVSNDYFNNIMDFAVIENGVFVFASPPPPPPVLPANPTQAQRDAHAAAVEAHQAAMAERAEQAQVINALNDVIDDMYRKERLAQYEAWQKGQGPAMPDFSGTTLTNAERIIALDLTDGDDVDLILSGLNAEERAVADALLADALKEKITGLENDWRESQLGTIHNPNFRSVSLTRQERRDILAANNINISALHDDISDSAFTSAMNAALAAANATDRDAANAALRTATENKILASMSQQQRDVFFAEVNHRNDNTEREEYNRVLGRAFDNYWRANSALGSNRLDFHNDIDPTRSWMVQTLGIHQDHVTEYMAYRAGRLADIEAATAARAAWFEANPGADEDDPSAPAIPAAPRMFSKWLEDEKGVNGDVFAFENRNVLHWNDTLADGAVLKEGYDRFQRFQIDNLQFLQGAYSENNAFNRIYSNGNAQTASLLGIPGQTVSAFTQSLVGKVNATSGADEHFSWESFAHYFNESSIRNTLNNVTFSDGVKINADVALATDGSGRITGVTLTAEKSGAPNVPLGMYSNSGNTFGQTPNIVTANTISTSTRLNELGLTPDDNGNFNIRINEVDFSFAANTTISSMMATINSNQRANVTMTFSTLTNKFEIKSKDFGTAAQITLGDKDEQGLLKVLGFDPGAVSETGRNMSLTINNEEVETSSNSYTVNGTTISISDNAKVGTSFNVEVTRDTTQMMDLIKQFVKDYNELIDYVFGYVNEKPDSQYHFLTDTDREELGLSETQENKWNDRAKKGLLYNDRVLTGIMGRMRTTMFTGVPRGDGTMFGLFSAGITTSNNWRQNGKLVIDEARLQNVIDNDIEMLTELFTNAEKGLMPQLQTVIDSAISPRGHRWEQGLLVQRAGLSNTSSERNNAIYDQIKRINQTINNLELRYSRQQDRFWKIFSSLEQQMGVLNSQGDHMAGLIGSMMGNNNR